MKKRLLLVYVFVAFVLLCTNVYAVVTMNLSLVANSKTIKQGDELEVTVHLENISQAISSIEGYINVDENVVGEISKDMIVATDNKIEVESNGSVTNKLSYVFNPTATNADYDVIFNTKKENINNNDCFFIMDLKRDIETKADVLKLKFKVKDDAEIKTVKDAVKIDCTVAFSASEGDKTEPMSAAIDIEVTKKADDKPADDKPTDEKPADDKKPADDNKNDNNNNGNNNNGNNNNGSNNGSNGGQNNNPANDKKNQAGSNAKNENTNKNNTNTNTNNNTNKANNTPNNNTNTNKDGTVAANKIPAAGAKTLILPVLACIGLAAYSYKKYMKYKDI